MFLLAFKRVFNRFLLYFIGFLIRFKADFIRKPREKKEISPYDFEWICHCVDCRGFPSFAFWVMFCV